MCARASMASWSFMPTASRAATPTPKARTPNARSRSSRAIRCSTPSSAKTCRRISRRSPRPLPCRSSQHIEAADRFFDATGAVFRHGGNRAYYAEGADLIQMPPCETFRDAGATPRPARTNSRTGPSMRSASRGTSGASISATKAMRVKSWLPNSDQRSSVPISASRPRCATIMRPISRHGSRC